MSNALEQARRAADEVSLNTSVRIDLALLQALIREIELLQRKLEHGGSEVGTDGDGKPVIVNFDKKA